MKRKWCESAWVAGRTFSVVLMVFVAGCSVPKTRLLPPEQAAALIGGLTTGHTTREQVLLRFGVPSARFEDDRILTYVMIQAEDDNGGKMLAVAARPDPLPDGFVEWKPGTYSMVLVFGATGVLQRHSVVGVRQ